MLNRSSASMQLDKAGNLKHLLTLEGLPAEVLHTILNKADTFFDKSAKVIFQKEYLKDHTVVNLFFEASTRTRSTFELAAKKLGANVLNFNVATSATSKGESLADTVKNLMAMQCTLFVVRHSASGAAQFVAQQVSDDISVINAGDGCHAHPTQALLDIYTIRKHRGDLSHLKVAIVGDVLHSRVARSQIHALQTLNTLEIRVIAPKTLLPRAIHKLNVKIFHDLKQGLQDVDVIIMLRLQTERMLDNLLPTGNAFYREYGLTTHALNFAKKDALIIHPGPINRGVEIESEIADSPNAVILDQVTNGIAIRMAVMTLLANNQERVKYENPYQTREIN
ncbi:MAG TPA: aspartate carbamoyltransferase catalytic subunit [Gammaproteobacteria bacterium]|nr:aspartate carbamoyltransferase catalytic subunit [Gammaproteobacteria bacterium]